MADGVESVNTTALDEMVQDVTSEVASPVAPAPQEDSLRRASLRTMSFSTAGSEEAGPAVVPTDVMPSSETFPSVNKTARVHPAVVPSNGSLPSKLRRDSAVLPPAQRGTHALGFVNLHHITNWRVAKWLASATNSVPWFIVITLCVVFSLVADDLRVGFLPKSVDSSFDWVMAVVTTVFGIEVIAYSIAHTGYALRFPFWVDTVAFLGVLLSLVLRSSQLTTTLVFVRLLRSFRALRLLKTGRAGLCTNFCARWQHRRKVATPTTEKPETALGKALMFRTNLKVVAALMLVVLGNETMNASGHGEDGLVAGLDVLHGMGANVSSDAVDHFLYATTERTSYPVRTLTVQGVTYVDLGVEDLRDSGPAEFSTLVSSRGPDSVLVVDTRHYTQARASMDLVLLAIVVFAIALWTWSFSYDLHKLVLLPVERILELLEHMARHPLDAINLKTNNTYKRASDSIGAEELVVIESSMAKVGRLLQLVVGEAGATIIARNLSFGTFNPVVKGQIVRGIFGFCDIRNFTDLCEILREDVLLFTNKAANLVHTEVHTNGGSVNKNIGDAFLCFWGLAQERRMSSVDADAAAEEEVPRVPSVTGLTLMRGLSNAPEESCNNESKATRALQSFINVVIALEGTTSMLSAAQLQDVHQKLPGYRVGMGFGLHYGWAVEGAIGTRYKIDASYLSPHVNMAARLESLTKAYQVPILFTDAVVSTLGPRLRRVSRLVDRVTVKGSKVPLELWTVDIAAYKASRCDAAAAARHADFLMLCNSAVRNYICGNWELALGQLRTAMVHRPDDVPCNLLQEYMLGFGGSPPPDWAGFHKLISK